MEKINDLNWFSIILSERLNNVQRTITNKDPDIINLKTVCKHKYEMKFSSQKVIN